MVETPDVDFTPTYSRAHGTKVMHRVATDSAACFTGPSS